MESTVWTIFNAVLVSWYKNNSIRKKTKVTFNFHLGELWKLDDTTLMDKTGIWQSPNGWNFVPVDNLSVDNKTMYYIENASNDTLVLGINGDDGKFVKFMNYEKATKFCEIFTLFLSENL